jgi:cyclopropane-fatty-acyl-phospholipid synthase
MDMPTTPRTHDLIAGSQRFARRPGWFARLVAPGFERILGRIDSALTSGTIHGVLPDGRRRGLNAKSSCAAGMR